MKKKRVRIFLPFFYHSAGALHKKTVSYCRQLARLSLVEVSLSKQLKGYTEFKSTGDVRIKLVKS